MGYIAATKSFGMPTILCPMEGGFVRVKKLPRGSEVTKLAGFAEEVHVPIAFSRVLSDLYLQFL